MEYSQLLEKLRALHPDVDFETEDKLIDNGILDSFDLVSLIAELADEFDIAIPAGKIIPQYFNSAKALFEMIQDLEDE